MLDRKYNDENEMDRHRNEPDDLSEGKPYLIVETSQHHEHHAECAVKTGRDGHVVLLQAGPGKQNHFQNIADNEDGPKGHVQVAKPHKSKSAIDVAERQKTQESRNAGYGYFF